VNAVAYIRRSKEDEAGQQLGLIAQDDAIRAWATYRGVEIVATVTDDGVSGARDPRKRPGWRRAMEMLDAGEADIVVFARLDRLSRTVKHFLAVTEQLGERLVCLDPEVDMTTATGRAIAHVFISFAQLERDLISERTKAALGAKKAGGWQRGKLTRADRARIIRLYRRGRSIADITRLLSQEQARTVHRTSVANVLRDELAGGRRGRIRRLSQPVSA
jgi:DNA invertase Pin-like site-specific DNA recombinase